MRPRFEISGPACRLRTSGSPEVNGAIHPAFSKLYSLPDLEETNEGSGIYDHWTGGAPFSYWWEFLSVWGILPGTTSPRSITLQIGGTNFPVDIYEYDEGTTLSGAIGTSVNDARGVVIICHGKLTLSGITTAARKRGFFIWADEVLGSANMTQKGAHCSGQNLPLYPGITVPATGGAGGTGATSSLVCPPGGDNTIIGLSGGVPSELGCGGGDGGNAMTFGYSWDSGSAYAKGGNGAVGTSYCGGAQGGHAYARVDSTGGYATSCVAGNGGANGSPGGSGLCGIDGVYTSYRVNSGDLDGNASGGGLLVVAGKIVSCSSLISLGTGAGDGCVVVLGNDVSGVATPSVGNGSYLIQEV